MLAQKRNVLFNVRGANADRDLPLLLMQAAAAATAVGVHHARAADAETSVAPAIEVRKASEASAVHEVSKSLKPCRLC